MIIRYSDLTLNWKEINPLYLIINAAQLIFCSLAAKQPVFYEKHFGHIGLDDEDLTAQGRFTLNAICSVTDDLKDGNYTTGIDKIDDVSYMARGEGGNNNLLEQELEFL